MQRAALGWCGALAALIAAAPVAGAVYVTQTQALAQAFPGAQVERRAFALTPAQAEAVEARARARLSSRLVAAYAAWRGDTLVGTAFFDSRIVRTMPGVFMVVVAPDSSVARVEVLAFHEPPDYLPPPRWLGLFGGRRLERGAGHDPGRLAGATLSARALGDGVRLALGLYETVVSPALAAGPQGAARR